MVDRDVACEGDHVQTAHRQGIRSAVKYLLSLGHRRIALINPSSGLRPAMERVAGYQEACEEFGVAFDPDLTSARGGPTDSGRDDIVRMLALPRPPTALIGLGTRQLSGALDALRESGLRIPQDFSVVGVGEPDLMEFAHPRLTTLRYDMETMGQAAARLMLDRLEGDSGGLLVFSAISDGTQS